MKYFKFLLLVALWCNCAFTPDGSIRSTNQAKAEPQPDVPLAGDERDRQVLESLMLHLLTDDEFRMTSSSISLPGTEKATNIVLHCRKLGGISFEIASEDWVGTDGPKHMLTSEMQSDLGRRNPTPKPGTKAEQMPSFGHLKFDCRIVVADVAAIPDGLRYRRNFETAHPRAKGWLAAYLPGYSKNGSQALVHAWVGPSAHGACLTALLERDGERWIVKWRHFAFYV